MKRIKANVAKVTELQARIGKTCAHLSYETPLYPDPAAKVAEWLQACDDTSQESARLLVAIQRTNLATRVTIELGGKQVEKTISEWVWRRRKFAAVDQVTWGTLGDRGLKEGHIPQSTGATAVPSKIVRNFDPVQRDTMLDMYRSESSRIDAALEIVNAVTDLIEA